jgi:hypothetical protein
VQKGAFKISMTFVPLGPVRSAKDEKINEGKARKYVGGVTD